MNWGDCTNWMLDRGWLRSCLMAGNHKHWKFNSPCLYHITSSFRNHSLCSYQNQIHDWMESASSSPGCGCCFQGQDDEGSGPGYSWAGQLCLVWEQGQSPVCSEWGSDTGMDWGEFPDPLSSDALLWPPGSQDSCSLPQQSSSVVKFSLYFLN